VTGDYAELRYHKGWESLRVQAGDQIHNYPTLLRVGDETAFTAADSELAALGFRRTEGWLSRSAARVAEIAEVATEDGL
jgi:hypothetical protein